MDLSTAAALARSAVAEASAVCRSLQGRAAALSKSDLSPVTVADFAAQAVVARRLAAHQAHSVAIVGEESADLLRRPENERTLHAALAAIQQALPDDPTWSNAGPHDLIAAVDLGSSKIADPAADYWTLDPIDGTKGFLRGQQYCTALALVRAGTPVVGVLGCPNLLPTPRLPFDESAVPPAAGALLWAVAGQGCRVEPLPPVSAAPAALRRGPQPAGPVRLATSLVSNDAVEDATARLLAHLPPGSRPMRLDSQGKYALVALEQADAFVRLPIARRTPESIWDHAAGAIVCSEAGCTVTDARGKPLDFGLGPTLAANRGIIAAPPPLHAELRRALDELGLSGP